MEYGQGSLSITLSECLTTVYNIISADYEPQGFTWPCTTCRRVRRAWIVNQ